MAKERGAFEIYNSEREQNNPFIQRLAAADPKLYEDMKKYGRRNIACLTIAPTGTTSLMTQTTSGIEPVFLPVYKRRRKVNPNDTNVHVDFVDETGDAFEEYIVFHHKFVTWMEANGYDPARRYTQEEIDELVAKSPYYKATSNDVDPFLVDEGEDAGKNPEMGRPLYQRNHQSAERCGRGFSKPPVCRGMEIRL